MPKNCRDSCTSSINRTSKQHFSRAGGNRLPGGRDAGSGGITAVDQHLQFMGQEPDGRRIRGPGHGPPTQAPCRKPSMTKPPAKPVVLCGAPHNTTYVETSVMWSPRPGTPRGAEFWSRCSTLRNQPYRDSSHSRMDLSVLHVGEAPSNVSGLALAMARRFISRSTLA